MLLVTALVNVGHQHFIEKVMMLIINITDNHSRQSNLRIVKVFLNQKELGKSVKLKLMTKTLTFAYHHQDQKNMITKYIWRKVVQVYFHLLTENCSKKSIVIFSLQRELEEKNKKLQDANLKIKELEKEEVAPRGVL